MPAIDLVQGKCVRLYRGDYSKQMTYSEDPVEQALKFQTAKFLRLHVVDLDGAKSGSGENREVIGQIIQTVRIPVQVGGGVRSEEDVSQLLGFGARYVILSTVAVKEPATVSQWVKKWGGESFIVSLDLRRGKLQCRGWTETSAVGVDEVIARCADWGVQQMICTDVERDGTMEQPHFDTYANLLSRLPPGAFLMAAGGVCLPEHLAQLSEMGVHGAVVGRALYEGQISWKVLADAG